MLFKNTCLKTINYFVMNLEKVFDFLSELEKNNNREWFKANEKKYKQVKIEFENFVNELLIEIKQFDGSINIQTAKECIFRINRDIRFSKDKSPYKTNFGAVIAKDGRKSPFAGYYVHLENNKSFVGGGIYMPQPQVLKAIRNEIYNSIKMYKKIIENHEFKKYYPHIYGEKLKLAPKGFPKDFADIDLLKNKHYALVYPIYDNKNWLDKNCISNITKLFKIQKPYNDFLNATLVIKK